MWGSCWSTGSIDPNMADTSKGFAAEWGFRIPHWESVGEVEFEVKAGDNEAWLQVQDYSWNRIPEPCVWVDSGVKGGDVWTKEPLGDNAVHTVRYVFQGETIKYYLDGVQYGTQSNNVPDANQAIYITVKSVGTTPTSGDQMVDTLYVRWSTEYWAHANITETSGSTSVNESGATTDTYTIALYTEPNENVTITVDPDVDTEVNGKGAGVSMQITFTPITWHIAQTITVKAIDDDIDEADPHTSTITHTAASSGCDYNGITIPNLSVSVYDDDTAGVTVAESDGTTEVDETGPTSDDYTLVLDSEPTDSVTITVDPDEDTEVNSGGGGVSIQITFTTGNWDSAQTITVTAIDDDIDETDPHTSTITHAASSSDGNYDSIGIDNVAASVADNDASGPSYTELGDTWTPSGTGWQTKDLAVYGVPANAICEIAIANIDPDDPATGGVRNTSSSQSRYAEMHEAESGGRDWIIMHVNSDAGSDIETYASSTARIRFVLLGYWGSGTYVETFDHFTVGSTGWNDKDLSGYSVGDGDVCEMLIRNDNGGAQRVGGVRKDGSALNRYVDIHEAERGSGESGNDYVTMMVEATSANGTIETYAANTSDIEFTLVGYWTTPPGTFNELASDISKPSSAATWEDKDLTSYGISASSICQIVCGNDRYNRENEMGVRENGSSIARKLDVHEGEGGGLDLISMHVAADADKKIEWYFERASGYDEPKFDLIGYWD